MTMTRSTTMIGRSSTTSTRISLTRGWRNRSTTSALRLSSGSTFVPSLLKRQHPVRVIHVKTTLHTQVRSVYWLSFMKFCTQVGFKTCTVWLVTFTVWICVLTSYYEILYTNRSQICVLTSYHETSYTGRIQNCVLTFFHETSCTGMIQKCVLTSLKSVYCTDFPSWNDS